MAEGQSPLRFPHRSNFSPAGRPHMPKIKFVKENKTIEVPAGTNLRQAARKEGVQLYSGVHKYVNCMGFGQCASCKVHIKKGQENCSKMGVMESMRLRFPLDFPTFLARIGHEDELRLACQTRVEGDIEVETTPPFNWHGERFWG